MTEEAKITEKEDVLIRKFQNEDEAFIFSTWMKGFYFGNSLFDYWDIPEEKFQKKYRPVIQNILENLETQVEVACLESDPSTILGYVVLGSTPQEIGPPTLSIHWIFTKTGFRRMGIAKLLIEDRLNAIQYYTHLTKIGKSLKKPHWEFDPFQL